MAEGHRHLIREERCQVQALTESGLSDGETAVRRARVRDTGPGAVASLAGPAGRSGNEVEVCLGQLRGVEVH